MRSKNILPVQVVSSSDLMGSSQSVHKAAFEEALHNSIESSLRSAAVVPSSVFSTLFFTLRQSSPRITDDEQDVKPNVVQLNEQISKHAGGEQGEGKVDVASPATVQTVSQHLTTAIASQSSPAASRNVAQIFPATPMGPPELIADHRSPDGRQLTARPPLPLITQQQHIEQLQRLKQLQRLHVWQQMQQKDQHSKAQPPVRNPSGSDVMYSGSNQLASSSRPQPMGLDIRKPPPPPLPALSSSLNGMHGNGTTQARPMFEARTARMPGFCKAGKDIRLTTLENDAMAMVGFPFSYALLCMQLNPRAGDSATLVIIALNLKSLPPPNTSAQALSAQCVGCGEKALHTFTQLSDHVGLETTVDLTSPRMSTNSSQLIGAHAQFYLVKDPKVPGRLIRGPPILWNKTQEGLVQSGLPSPRAGMLPVMAPPPHLVSKPSVPALPPVPRLPSVSQHHDSPLQNAIHRLHHGQAHPLLGRSISGSSQRAGPDSLKRLNTALTIGDDEHPHEHSQPKRYMINRDTSSYACVDVSPELATNAQRKPVIVYLYPATNLPRFTGDTSNVTVTQTFAECFKEPLTSIKEQLDFADHSPLSNDVMLLITMQYIVSLGADGELIKEGLSHMLVQARRNMTDSFRSAVVDLKPSGVVGLAALFASTSQGRVAMVVSELSCADAITQCLRNLSSPPTPLYQLAVYSASAVDGSSAGGNVQFHLVVSSKRKCRSIGESLLSVEDQAALVKQSLVSLPFTQLRLALSVWNSVPHRPSSSAFQPFAPQRVPSNHTSSSAAECPTLQEYQTDLVTALTAKVFESQPNLDFSLFTSLRFMFLLPPCPALHSQTVSTIAQSGVLSEIYKTLLPGSALSSQVVMTMEPSSKQRLLSVCKQWEETSTLLVLIQLEASHTSNCSEEGDFLNNSCVADSRNVLMVQCSAAPYLLATNRSRVAPGNVVHAPPSAKHHGSATDGARAGEPLPLTTTYDPQYEAVKWELLENNFMLHTSLVACELILQQYIGAIAHEALGGDQELSVESRRLLTPAIQRPVQDLMSSSRMGDGVMLVVRVPSSTLATRFHDALTDAREKLGLEQVFEVALYSSCDKEISLSRHFLKIVKGWHADARDWTPTSLDDLTGIPCIVVYEGEGMVAQRVPTNVRHVDLRMAFEGAGDLNRSMIEQELWMCYPVCRQSANATARSTESPPKKRLKPSSDDEGALHVVEPDEGDNPTPAAGGGDAFEEAGVAWDEDATKQSGENGCRKRERRSTSAGSPLDFVSMAMKEANLTSAGRGKNAGAVGHTQPTVLLTRCVHQLLEGGKQGLPTVTGLPPHHLSTWIDPLHPQLSSGSTPRQEVEFYRKWCKPVHGHPDFFDGTLLTNNETSKERFLLITRPTVDTAKVCCLFLRQLHNSLMKLHEVEVYDDGEDLEDVDCDSPFRTLLPNPQCRGQSQIVNSCDYLEKLSTAGRTEARKVVTTFNSNMNASSVRPATEEPHNMEEVFETKTLVLSASGYKGDINYHLHVPKKFTLDFIYARNSNGEAQLRTLRMKCKGDAGIKTPIVSIAHHAPHLGLYNLGNAASSGMRLSDGSEPMHVIVARHRDGDILKKSCVDSVLVVLPPEFDFLGRGALKFAAQVLFQHFYETESKRQQDPGSVWPYVMFVDDDCVSWSSWSSATDEFGERNGNWSSLSFGEVMERLETAVGGDQYAAVGLRRWTQDMKEPHMLPNAECLENENRDLCNYVSERVIDSCLMLDLRKTTLVAYNHNRFLNEDVDWSVRAASSGLRVCRLENVAVAVKAIESAAGEVVDPERSRALMIAADSEFEPLAIHPSRLLETYFVRDAPEVFPRSRSDPAHPVLCLDCYVSLGPEIFVEFTSSHPLAPSWSIDCSKEYGGLLLFCPGANVQPEFLHEFSFVEGATVCVIGNDRSSLRHSVVKLNLERDWHFRLTDEFQTANSDALGGAKIRPLYFLTGVHKKSTK